jgi:hypothetical protein
MYNTPFMNAYNSQSNIDRINNQIAELEKLKQQIPQQPVQPITQNFQIAPTNREVIRYANSMDEVIRDMVVGDTPYFSKDMSVVWIKNVKGEIKTYELNEIIPKDSKDLKIEYLQAQIEQLKKGMNRYESNAIVDESITESVEGEKSSNVSTISKSTKKSK